MLGGCVNGHNRKGAGSHYALYKGRYASSWNAHIFTPPATYLGENSRIRRVFKAGDAVQRGPFQGNRPRYFARKVDVLPLEERRGFVNVSFD